MSIISKIKDNYLAKIKTALTARGLRKDVEKLSKTEYGERSRGIEAEILSSLSTMTEDEMFSVVEKYIEQSGETNLENDKVINTFSQVLFDRVKKSLQNNNFDEMNKITLGIPDSLRGFAVDYARNRYDLVVEDLDEKSEASNDAFAYYAINLNENNRVLNRLVYGKITECYVYDIQSKNHFVFLQKLKSEREYYKLKSEIENFDRTDELDYFHFTDDYGFRDKVQLDETEEEREERRKGLKENYSKVQSDMRNCFNLLPYESCVEVMEKLEKSQGLDLYRRGQVKKNYVVSTLNGNRKHDEAVINDFKTNYHNMDCLYDAFKEVGTKKLQYLHDEHYPVYVRMMREVTPDRWLKDLKISNTPSSNL